jgi:hypothetical protein
MTTQQPAHPIPTGPSGKILMTREGIVVDGNLRARALMEINGAIPEEVIQWVREDGTPE